MYKEGKAVRTTSVVQVAPPPPPPPKVTTVELIMGPNKIDVQFPGEAAGSRRKEALAIEPGSREDRDK